MALRPDTPSAAPHRAAQTPSTGARRRPAGRPSEVTLYRVRLELDEPVSRGPKADEIRHQLHDYNPVLCHNGHGKTEITLHITSLDIWSSLLTIMAALKQVWYEPCAVEFIRYDELERRAS